MITADSRVVFWALSIPIFRLLSDRTVNSGVVESATTNPLRFEGTEIRLPSASVVLATGGSGATYDDQTRIVYTKVRPVLKTADFLAAAPVAFMGLRLLDGTMPVR